MFGRKHFNRIKGLTDMHNHILFGVDDGAEDIEISMTMLKQAYEDGIDKLVLTPHCHPRRGNETFTTISEHFNILKDRVELELPDIRLYLGREVYYSSEIEDNPEYLLHKTMMDSSNVLIEFSFDVDEAKIRSATLAAIMAGYHPIIAHIERYACTVEDYDYVYELKQLGADIQINADSVLGKNGGAIKKCCKNLLKEELVDYVATDAHGVNNRKAVLSECYFYIEKKYGEEYANKLMCYDPVKVFL